MQINKALLKYYQFLCSYVMNFFFKSSTFKIDHIILMQHELDLIL